MRQRCVRNASKWVLFYWEKRNVPKCVRNALNTFGGGHLLDDTEVLRQSRTRKFIQMFGKIVVKQFVVPGTFSVPNTEGHLKRGYLQRDFTFTVNFSAAPQQSEICVKFSVFHTVFAVKFW